MRHSSLKYPWNPEDPDSPIRIKHQPEWQGPHRRQLQLFLHQFRNGLAGDRKLWDEYHRVKYLTPEERKAGPQKYPEMWAVRVLGQLQDFAVRTGLLNDDDRWSTVESPDESHSRFITPPCPICGGRCKTTGTRKTSRTIKCNKCSHTWPEPKK